MKEINLDSFEYIFSYMLIYETNNNETQNENVNQPYNKIKLLLFYYNKLYRINKKL